MMNNNAKITSVSNNVTNHSNNINNHSRKAQPSIKIEIVPDEVLVFTKEEVNANLGINFDGTGWYETESKTILAIPLSVGLYESAYRFLIYNNRNPIPWFRLIASYT